MSQRELLPSVSSRTGAVLITVAVLVAVAGPGVAVGSVGASDSPDDLSVQAQQERTGVAVSLVPDTTVAVNETATYDLVVELPNSAADGNVGAYDLTVEVSNTTVASLTEVNLSGAIVPPEPVADDGSSARVTGALGDEDQALTDDDADGAVTVATVTATGDAQGESDLSLSVDTISTASGKVYDVAAVDGGSITVESDDDGVSGGSDRDPGTDSGDGDDGADSGDDDDGADSSDGDDGADSGDSDGTDSSDGDGTDSSDGDGADSGDGDESDVESGATTDQGDTSQSDADDTSEQDQQQESVADSSETEPEAEAGGFQNPTAIVLVALVSLVAILTAAYYLRRQ
jgi:Cobalamin biosynthesis protein CobT (nicotinate-mononucleotide:5, 6-dimethylbenzimidazole phosphoribosyltransferase)